MSAGHGAGYWRLSVQGLQSSVRRAKAWRHCGKTECSGPLCISASNTHHTLVSNSEICSHEKRHSLRHKCDYRKELSGRNLGSKRKVLNVQRFIF